MCSEFYSDAVSVAFADPLTHFLRLAVVDAVPVGHSDWHDDAGRYAESDADPKCKRERFSDLLEHVNCVAIAN